MLRNLCVALALFLLVVDMRATEPKNVYNGHWWLSADHDHHLGFVEGFVDCSAWTNPRDQFYNGIAFEEIVRKVDAFYARNQQDTSTPIVRAFHQALSPARPQTTPTSTFGIADGETWRQASDGYRLGFVQGYLDCLSGGNKDPTTGFTRRPDWYVGRISEWYGIDPHDSSAIDPKRAGAKTAKVLFRFRERVAK